MSLRAGTCSSSPELFTFSKLRWARFRRALEDVQQLLEHEVLREPLRPRRLAVLGPVQQREQHFHEDVLPERPEHLHSAADRPSEGVLGVIHAPNLCLEERL